MRKSAWLVVALLAWSAGCRSRPEPCVVTGVTVEEVTGPSPMRAIGVEREALRAVALEALGGTAGFVIPSAEPPRGAPRCRATIALLDARLLARPDGVDAEVLLRMDVAAGEDADAVSERIRGSERVDAAGPSGAFRRAIRSCAMRGASALALALAEARKPDADVIRDLESADPRLRELAVGVLADRKNPAAVPGLVARLQDPDPDVADRAVGALAQIGDPRAVGPIIALSRRREGPFVAQMARAIGDIGGTEAEAYLETLAAGHADPAVAEAAREALRDARRRRAAGRAVGEGR